MRTAVVTGAASGIGAAEVARLRARGAHVVGDDRDERVNQLRSRDADYIGLAGDIIDPDYAAELVALAEQRFGPVDLTFHSAGIMPGGLVVTSTPMRSCA
ncbi:SDR family NAD(P)-dependent oxidoreductase [Arthrobacter sp. NPDC057013]|uniref:SDR family NAD(P)-dependent oxidoreductase n=1 Tax=Arthrobacter sp. NPDC057013 TaxID=3345999 RepID=UPI003635661D